MRQGWAITSASVLRCRSAVCRLVTQINMIMTWEHDAAKHTVIIWSEKSGQDSAVQHSFPQKLLL